MGKLPNFTDVSALMSKFKSAFDNLAGPGSATEKEEALANETNPTKAKLLEVELLINRIHDMMVLQVKAINDLNAKYAEVKKLATAALVPVEEPVKPATTQGETPPSDTSPTDTTPPDTTPKE